MEQKTNFEDKELTAKYILEKNVNKTTKEKITLLQKALQQVKEEIKFRTPTTENEKGIIPENFLKRLEQKYDYLFHKEEINLEKKTLGGDPYANVYDAITNNLLTFIHNKKDSYKSDKSYNSLVTLFTNIYKSIGEIKVEKSTAGKCSKISKLVNILTEEPIAIPAFKNTPIVNAIIANIFQETIKQANKLKRFIEENKIDNLKTKIEPLAKAIEDLKAKQLEEEQQEQQKREQKEKEQQEQLKKQQQKKENEIAQSNSKVQQNEHSMSEQTIPQKDNEKIRVIFSSIEQKQTILPEQKIEKDATVILSVQQSKEQIVVENEALNSMTPSQKEVKQENVSQSEQISQKQSTKEIFEEIDESKKLENDCTINEETLEKEEEQDDKITASHNAGNNFVESAIFKKTLNSMLLAENEKIEEEAIQGDDNLESKQESNEQDKKKKLLNELSRSTIIKTMMSNCTGEDCTEENCTKINLPRLKKNKQTQSMFEIQFDIENRKNEKQTIEKNSSEYNFIKTVIQNEVINLPEETRIPEGSDDFSADVDIELLESGNKLIKLSSLKIPNSQAFGDKTVEFELPSNVPFVDFMNKVRDEGFENALRTFQESKSGLFAKTPSYIKIIKDKGEVVGNSFKVLKELFCKASRGCSTNGRLEKQEGQGISCDK